MVFPLVIVRQKRWVTPGKFFYEMMLKLGIVMTMPDIKDKLPQRSFLRCNIFTKFPCATTKLKERIRVWKR